MFIARASCLMRQTRLRLCAALAGVATLFGAGAALAQNAYIPNQTSNDVTVINTATNTFVATIAVGNQPRGVGVTPDGARAYISNAGGNTVSVINASTNTIAATVTVGGGSHGGGHHP